MSGGYLPLMFAAEVMLASISVIGTTLFFLNRARKQLKAMQLRAEQDITVVQFLRREISATGEFLRSQNIPDGQLRLLARLRKLWLHAEALGAIDGGRRPSDVQVMQKNLGSLFSLLERDQKARSAVPGDSAASDLPVVLEQEPSVVSQRGMAHTIEVQRKAIVDLRNLVSRYREQLQEPLSAKDAGIVDQTPILQSLDVAQVSTPATGDGFEAERYRQACVRIEALTAEVIKLKSSMTVSALSPMDKSPDNPQESALEFLADINTSHQHSAAEVVRLHDSNRRQRELLMRMEGELDSLRKGAASEGPSHAVLQELKLQLRDYEMCTATLEAETDNLRERLQVMGQVIEQAEKSNIGALSEAIQREITGTVEMKRFDEKRQQMWRSLLQIAATTELELAAQRLVDLLGIFEIESTLFIQASDKELWQSAAGFVEERERVRLRAMAPVSNEIWQDVDDCVVVICDHYRILLRGKVLTDNYSDLLKENLLGLFSVADNLISSLLTQDRNGQLIHSLQTKLHSLKKPLQAIEIQHRYVFEEGTRVLETFNSELTNYMEMIEASQIQRQILQDMVSDFGARMTLLDSGMGPARKMLEKINLGFETFAG